MIRLGGLVAAGLLVAGCSSVASPSPRPTSRATGSPAASQAGSPVEQAQEMLDRRSEAVVARNLTAFTATIAADATSASRQQQRSAFTSSLALPFRSWQLQIAAAAAEPPASGHWMVSATLTYAFRGYDATPVSLVRTLSLSRSVGGWTVAADAQRNAPWDFGPLTVLAGARSLVIVNAARRSAAVSLMRLAEAAVPVVTRAWGTDWPQRVVVIVPASLQQLEAEVGTASDLSQLAAVQAAELGGAHGPTGDRVLINAGVFLDKTSALGQQVVLTHEITHVASAASTTANVPLWLVEGLADTVAFGTTTLTPAAGAPELASQVRAGRVPRALPANAAFSATSSGLVLAYEQAWLACRLIMTTVGMPGLVRFYRAVGSGKPLDTALAGTLHTTPAHFTTAWLAALRSELA